MNSSGAGAEDAGGTDEGVAGSADEGMDDDHGEAEIYADEEDVCADAWATDEDDTRREEERETGGDEDAKEERDAVDTWSVAEVWVT